MYWSVWAGLDGGGAARIEAAAMDASRRRALLADDLTWPNGLVIDLQTHYLYWCDVYLNKIERILVTSSGDVAPGAKRELLLKNTPETPLSKPYGLAVYEDWVVWSEHGSGLVRRLLANGSVDTLRAFSAPLYDIRLVSAAARSGKNACSHNNGGCPELCLPTAPDERRCAGAGGAAAGGAEAAPCPAKHFHCGQGRCIDSSFVCDGDADCPDGSDEDTSPTGPCANVTCNEDQFMQCDSSRCIPKSWICDGLKDCSDGADETARACSQAACAPGLFTCARSRRCLPAAWRCDGAPDCGARDRSDEQGCAAAPCAAPAFRCAAGACLPWEYVCDGHADCAGADDERACAATPEPAPDAAPRRRRPHHNETDKHGLCEDHEFQCNNRECIRMEFRCDLRVDCLDGSDEAGCPAAPAPPAAAATAAAPAGECAAPAVRCDNDTRCVPLQQLCDGAQDCADGADEADRCGSVFVPFMLDNN
ncbi:unnamed protein product, partial [Brenthis ino]